MDKRSFAQEIYSIVADIPVGRAMHHAPAELHLPCHRVVNSQGRLAPGWGEQYELLANEGVLFKKNGCVNTEACSWNIFLEN